MTTPQPTTQDLQNAAVRAEIAASMQAEYDECAAWAEQLFGPGWEPACRHYLVDKTEEEEARMTGRRPSAAATVYTCRQADTGEKRHFMLCDGRAAACASMEDGFGPMLVEPHPTRRIEVRGEVVAPHRYSLCWAGYATYRPKSAGQLAAARAKREERAVERLAETQPLFADQIRSGEYRPGKPHRQNER